MDLIKDIEERDRLAREERQTDFADTRLIASHNGEVMDIEGFKTVRVSTLLDVFSVPKTVICLISDEDSKLAELLSLSPEHNGCNFAHLVDLPGQETALESSRWLATFREISLVTVLTDIADQRMVEDSMTEEELNLSVAKKQHSQRARKDGEIRPLLDFDGGVEDDELDQTVEV